MIVYAFLISIAILVWCFGFILSGYELFSPASITLLGYILSLLLGAIGLTSWNNSVLSSETIKILLVGFLGILTATLIFGQDKQLTHKGVRKVNTGTAHHVLDEEIKPWKCICISLLLIFACLLRVYESMKLGIQLGLDTSDYATLASNIRHSTSTLYSTDAIVEGIGYSFIEKQLEKIAYMSGFVVSFILALDMKNRKYKRFIGFLCIFVLCCIFQLLAGGRGMIFYWVISFFVSHMLLVYHDLQQDERLHYSLIILRRGALTALIIAAFMYFAGSLVGREAQGSVLEYASFYFGGSVPSLNTLLYSESLVLMDEPVHVFYSVYLFLLKIGKLNTLVPYSLSWINLNGHWSNIYTSFARYYFDYGIVGVYLLSLLSTSFLSIIYNRTKRAMKPYMIVITSYLSAFAFDSAREEFIFSRLIGTTQLVNIVMLVVIALFLTSNFSPAISESTDRASGMIDSDVFSIGNANYI